MTIQECYDFIGGDFEDVKNRLIDEQRVQRFAFKFLDDNNFHTLCEAFEHGDDEMAFRASHTIKGLCANLSFKKLLSSSSALTEALRNGRQDGAEALFEQVRQDYKETVDALKKCKEDASV